jgi:hypothetical protein
VAALDLCPAVVLKLSVLQLAARPTGSKTQAGACAPSTFSTARSGEAVRRARSPHAEPARPAWMNMPMITIMARWPFTVSATRLPVFAAGSEGVGTLNLKSPLAGPARSLRRPGRQGHDSSPRPESWRWRQVVRHLRELQAGGRREVTRQLASLKASTAMTLSISTWMRLNSSKRAQAPAWARPLKTKRLVDVVVVSVVEDHDDDRRARSRRSAPEAEVELPVAEVKMPISPTTWKQSQAPDHSA